MIEDELEQALLDGRSSGFEIRATVAVQAVGDIEPDVAAAIEGGQDLQAPEQQRQAPHRKTPIVVRSGVECLRPGCRQVRQATGLQHRLYVARGSLWRLGVLEDVTADGKIEGLLAEARPDP